jgi:hypothetical protein
MAWNLFLENSWRLRTAGIGGVVGLDLNRAERQLLREGIEPELAEALLAACEVGFVKAANEKDEDGQE